MGEDESWSSWNQVKEQVWRISQGYWKNAKMSWKGRMGGASGFREITRFFWEGVLWICDKENHRVKLELGVVKKLGWEKNVAGPIRFKEKGFPVEGAEQDERIRQKKVLVGCFLLCECLWY